MAKSVWLLDCPFCKAKPRLIKDFNHAIIHCSQCGVQFDEYAETIRKAVAKVVKFWNTRNGILIKKKAA